MHIHSRNNNTVAPTIYQRLETQGVPWQSRNGPVLMLPDPITVTLTNPEERVNFSRKRDANPFFHLFEAMAMLHNMNDVDFLSHFAKNMRNYSDDGKKFNAFYGTRARVQWGDQLAAVIDILKKDPDTRRAVVNLWDPEDLCKETKDMACNLCMVFRVLDGKLDMITFNRSNDAIWGYVTGANIVHFAFFQEYVARSVGLPIGNWHHTSANLHVYTDNPQWERIKNMGGNYTPYTPTHPDHETVKQVPIFEGDRYDFDGQIGNSLEIMYRAIRYAVIIRPVCYHRLPTWFSKVLFPAFNTWQIWKTRELHTAINYLSNNMIDCDWKLAMQFWLERRAK